MTNMVANIERYFGAVDAAFRGLVRVFETEGEWVKRHNRIHRICKLHLDRLRVAHECWELSSRFWDKFKIDTRDSGFPVFQHVLQLENDSKQAERRLEEIATAHQIRKEMIELLLKHREHPGDLQRKMAERLYFETLADYHAYSTHTTPYTVRHSINRRTGRHYYVVQWATYDGSAHLPIIYVAVIEDSSDDPPPPPADRQDGHKPWPEGEAVKGLPNRQLSAQFRAFTEAHSSYSLTLTTIATALDKDFPELHPKQLRRFIVGPFYAGGFTNHNEEVQGILDKVDDPESMWLMTWTAQELYSKEERPARWGLWGKSAPEEVFHIDTDNVDCVRQGVSAVERRALIPHEAYQAVYTQGRVDEILGDYECYIASGDHIIRNV